MPRKPELDAHGLRHKRFWPHLTADQQATLLEFLAWWRATAEHAHDRAAELAAIAKEDTGAQGMAQWWAHAIRTIDWLLHRVPQRQQYLEIKLAQAEGRWRDKAPARAT